MIHLKVNGIEHALENDKKLIHFLRDDLALFSVKNGCEQGACGTCSVIIDEKLVRSCIMPCSKVEGKEITTLEGLSESEKQTYVYAFGKAGAVQCGFCIPGMVMAAKVLIDKNPSPTDEEIKTGIKNNICRCTGYTKIIDAIRLAAKILRGEEAIPDDEELGKVGETTIRVDSADKILGIGKYVDDYVFENMTFATVLRPKDARMKIHKIDATQALKVPGVIAVYTAKDVPGAKKIGHLQHDYPIMIAEGEETRFIGDALAIIVAETEEAAMAGREQMVVDATTLTPINNPFEAMKEDAPQLHAEGFMQFGKHFVPKNNMLSYQELKRGDAEDKLKKSAHVSEHDFFVPFTEHAFMEPECSIAYPEGDGVRVITGGQGIYDEYREITEMLGLEDGKVRIQSALVGGGFGGKEDMSVQHHAALAAFLSKRIVKIRLSRQESIELHPKRHAMWLNYKVGCDEKGKLTGMMARIISDTGAYASLGGPVLQRACTHAAGPYNFQDVDIEGRAYYTNNPPAGAFRGFGVTQSCFAMESCINELAEKVGMNGWEFRHLNAVKPGDELPNGQIVDAGTSFQETLETVKDYYDEMNGREDVFVGIASAMKNSGLGVGVPDTGRCHLAVIDKKVHVRSSAGAIGQGMQTVLLQMTCESTGLRPSDLVIEHPDSLLTPNSGTTTASRQTVFTGEATRRAGLKLKEALQTKTLEELEGEIFKGEYSFDSDPMGSPKKNPVSHVAYGYATQVAVIDKEGKVIEFLASHDVGKAINPVTTEGQIEGGVVMCMGYALTEDFPLADGKPLKKYGTLGLLRANQVPEIKTLLIEQNDVELAYGAKGVGEIAAIPAAPALQNAYYKLDGCFRTDLPMENTFYKKNKK